MNEKYLNGSSKRDRSDDSPHLERTLYHWATSLSKSVWYLKNISDADETVFKNVSCVSLIKYWNKANKLICGCNDWVLFFITNNAQIRTRNTNTWWNSKMLASKTHVLWTNMNLPFKELSFEIIFTWKTLILYSLRTSRGVITAEDTMLKHYMDKCIKYTPKK